MADNSGHVLRPHSNNLLPITIHWSSRPSGNHRVHLMGTWSSLHWAIPSNSSPSTSLHQVTNLANLPNGRVPTNRWIQEDQLVVLSCNPCRSPGFGAKTPRMVISPSSPLAPCCPETCTWQTYCSLWPSLKLVSKVWRLSKSVFSCATHLLCPVANRPGGKIFSQVLLESGVKNNQKYIFSCGHIDYPVSSFK